MSFYIKILENTFSMFKLYVKYKGVFLNSWNSPGFAPVVNVNVTYICVLGWNQDNIQNDRQRKDVRNICMIGEVYKCDM